MPVYSFSRLAETDLLSIGAYTLREWGEEQAIRYLADLEVGCQMLAENPALGRSCDEIRPGLHRMERGRHVLFYRAVTGGILILRILHQRMLPEEHTIDNQDEEQYEVWAKFLLI